MTAALTGPVTGAALLAAAGCLAYALVGPRLARRLPPAVATRWLVVAALLVAVSSVLVVVAVAATWVGLLPGVGELGPWSAQRLRADSRVPPAVGIACAALVCVALVRLAVTVYRRAASIVSVVRCCRRLPPTVDRVVVVDSPKVEAFTTPPPGARIVVTSALLRHLPPDEGRALLAHERSHLTHRHVWWILAADLAAAVNPLLVPTADAVRRTVERWADEDAARVVADRTLLARSLARTALLAHGSADRIPRATGGDVADRVRAMLSPPPRLRLLPAAALAVLLTLALVAAAAVPVDTEEAFDRAAYAPAGRTVPHPSRHTSVQAPVIRVPRTRG